MLHPKSLFYIKRLCVVKKNKFILDVNYEFDFVLIGIISAARDFKLAWLLNQILEINLSKINDLDYHLSKNDTFLISNFIYETDFSIFRLIKNRAVEFFNIKKPYLLPELKSYDYFVLLNGEFAAYYPEYILKIRDIPDIQLVKQVDYEALPSKENLLIY